MNESCLIFWVISYESHHAFFFASIYSYFGSEYIRWFKVSIIYLSVYLSVCRYISCFQDLILVSCSTINIGMHLLLKYDIFQLSWEDTQKRYIESSEIWNSIFWGISVPISKVFVWVYINSVWKYPYYFILANIWDYDSFLKNAHENFYKMCSLML